MMKRKVAVAALGMVAGVALAQSSVTLYGQVDLNYQHVRSGNSAPLAG